MLKLMAKELTKKIKNLNRTESLKIGLIVFLFLVIVGGLLFYFKHLFVVALVDNRPITRFALDRELEKQAGQQILDNLVGESLILQEAKRQGVKISQAEVNAKVEEVRGQLKEQGNDLEALLEAQGQTLKSFEKQVKNQLIIEELVGKDIAVTEEEIEAYFNENQDFFEEGVVFEDVKDDLKEQIRQGKLSTNFQSWLSELKEKAKIHYFLSF